MTISLRIGLPLTDITLRAGDLSLRQANNDEAVERQQQGMDLANDIALSPALSRRGSFDALVAQPGALDRFADDAGRGGQNW